MTLEKGTLIFANVTATVKATGEGIESTREEEAKKLNIYDATRKYEPRLVAVGEGWLISGLDDEVKKMDVGEKKQIEVPPQKAYGLRDPTQTRMIPLRKFGDKADELEVGDSVDIDDRVGIVRFIGSGRAQVDFNHRLAGKSILYDFEVTKKVETDEDKVKALIDRRFAGEGGKLTIKLQEGKLDVAIPEDLFLVEGLQIIKRGVSNDVFKFVPAISEMTFTERFANANAAKPEPPKEEAKPKSEAAPSPTTPPKSRRKKATAKAAAPAQASTQTS